MAKGGVRRSAVLAALALVVTGCGTDANPEAPATTAPSPKSAIGDCGALRIAYDPSNGYEASAFIIGALARSQLECDVTYVKTTSRKAWRLVARGNADVYLDAYGSPDLTATLAGEGGPVTVLGPNGVRGGVDLLAPFFVQDDGIGTARDLEDLPADYFGSVTPSISTVPALLPLAQSFVDFQRLEFNVKDYVLTHPRSGMGNLLQAPAVNDENGASAFFLVAGPRAFLGDGPGRLSIEIPDSAAGQCVPNPASTLCSLEDFEYMKIVNSRFADSRNPAYNLVYNYSLPSAQAATILELVQLSGFDVGEADVVSWINTHQDVWKRWLKVT
jgi:glycine betaine/proline transport system substrate-binding protein